MLENRVVSKIFGPKRDGVTGEWIKLHKKKLCDLLTKYYSGNQIEKNEMDGSRNTHGGEERCIQGFGGKRRPLGRTRNRWMDNNKIDLQEEG